MWIGCRTQVREEGLAELDVEAVHISPVWSDVDQEP